MVMLSSFQLLWSLCTRALWTWSLVWGEGGWLILRRKVTSSTSFVKPPVYVCVARVLCICVSITGLGYLLIQFSHSVVSNSLQPHGLQHARPPCPSPTPRAYANSCPLSQWCHQTILSSVVPFSSHLQSFPASGSSQSSQFFASGGQSIGVSASASVFPMNIQDWFPLWLTGLISLQFKGFSRVFSNTTVQKHQFFSTQLSL